MRCQEECFYEIRWKDLLAEFFLSECVQSKQNPILKRMGSVSHSNSFGI